MNNRVTRAAGGPDCIWSGMNSGSVSTQARSFRDLREICRRADIVMLDHQHRDDDTGFQQNGDTGKRIHGLLGWDKLAPESMAMYESGPGYFRLASKPATEARMWMIAGIAGGIQPWWHYVAAFHDDRRMYDTPGPVMKWYKENERYLVDRQPVASVGVVWSQRNTDFFGRNESAERVDAPYSGFMHALVRARIPYLPVHIDDLDRQGQGFKLLVLPNVGALSDSQCASIRRYVDRGGSLFATGETSLGDEWGDPRPDFGLAELFGAHSIGAPPNRRPSDVHTYLRIARREPRPVLKGFEKTDILPYGGSLVPLKVAPEAVVPLTFIPPFPTYPPETAWMRQETTDIPGLILTMRGKSRIAFMPADIDRRYEHEHLPDHGDLLANVVRWATADEIPLAVESPGLLDCHLYTQNGRTLLHIVNLTSTATWRAPAEEMIPVGPVKVRVRVSGRPSSAELLVSKTKQQVSLTGNIASFEMRSISDHEFVLL
jgi:hypothetical protein